MVIWCTFLWITFFGHLKRIFDQYRSSNIWTTIQYCWVCGSPESQEGESLLHAFLQSTKLSKFFLFPVAADLKGYAPDMPPLRFYRVIGFSEIGSVFDECDWESCQTILNKFEYAIRLFFPKLPDTYMLFTKFKIFTNGGNEEDKKKTTDLKFLNVFFGWDSQSEFLPTVNDVITGSGF